MFILPILGFSAGMARFVLRLCEKLSEKRGEVSGQYQWLLRKRVFIVPIKLLHYEQISDG